MLNLLLEILALLILNCLMIGGVWSSTRYDEHAGEYIGGEIFGWINYWCEKNLPEKLWIPLFGCIKCMASIWSFPYIMYSMTIWKDPGMLLYYPIYILALCGLNTIYDKHIA
jgi:hypothetical protein